MTLAVSIAVELPHRSPVAKPASPTTAVRSQPKPAVQHLAPSATDVAVAAPGGETHLLSNNATPQKPRKCRPSADPT